MRIFRGWAVIGVAFSAIALTACGGPAGGSSRTEAGSRPVEVENCGRTLTFAEPPSRVVTDYQPGLEMLIELGVEDRILGRAAFEENVGEPDEFLPGHKAVYDSLREVSDGYFPVKEEMVALEADLALATSFLSFDPGLGLATKEDLEAVGTQVFVTGDWCDKDGKNNYRLRDTLDDIVDLGRIFGVSDRAAVIVADLEARMAAVKEAVEGQEPIRVLIADPAGETFYAMGSGMGTQILEAAGAVNVFPEADEYGEVSVEEVAAANADAYVIIRYLPTTVEQRIAAIEQAAPDSPGVRDKRYVVIPAVAIHPGVRNFSAVETIAQDLHPEAFE